jgi:hypothetical protein
MDLRSLRYLCFVIFFFLFFTTLLMGVKRSGNSTGLAQKDLRNRAFVYIIFVIRHNSHKFLSDPLAFLHREKASIS